MDEKSNQEIRVSTVFRRSGDVRYRIIDGEAVVIRQEAGEVLGLNETAARLLDLVDAESTVQELIDTMAEEYTIERSKLEEDVMKFLNELRGAGVIEETRAGDEQR
jgi:hypothetical protein